MPAIRRKMSYMRAGSGAMWPSANESPSWVVIGNPGSRRVELFQAALAGLGLPVAQLVSYADLLAGRVQLASVVADGTIVRIESPGKDYAVEQALVAWGGALPDDEGDRYTRMDPAVCLGLPEDRGLLLPLRQWYLGFRAAVHMIAQQLAICPPHRLMAAPDELLVMFDKRACH